MLIAIIEQKTVSAMIIATGFRYEFVDLLRLFGCDLLNHFIFPTSSAKSHNAYRLRLRPD